MDELLANLRESADKLTWSKGVALSRELRIRRVKASADEIVVQVFVPGRTISPLVKLWPDDGDWNCDCMGKVDPCEHAVAAAIFAKHAEGEQDNAVQGGTEQEEKAGSRAAVAGEVGYEFCSEQRKLQVKRVILASGMRLPFKGRLGDLTQGSVPGLPRVSADKLDVEAELLFEQQRLQGIQPPWFVAKMLKILNGGKSCFYLDRKVVARSEPVGWYAVVEDVGGGVEISGRDDERIVERFENGFVFLCDDIIAPYNDAELSEQERSSLQNKMVFGRKDFTFVVSELLPALEKKVRVEKRSQHLPELQAMVPRILWEAKAGGVGLRFVAKIAYGEPAVAVVEDGQLLSRGGKVVPLRNLNLEKELETKLKGDFRASFGEIQEYGLSAGMDLLRAIENRGHEVGGIERERFRKLGQVAVSWNVEYEPENGEFPLRFGIRGEDGREYAADEGALLRAFGAGESLVPLTPCGFGELPRGWFAKYGDKVKQLLAGRDDEGKLPKAMAFAVADLMEEMGQGDDAWLAKLKSGMDRAFAGADFARVQATLRGYQEEGAKWLASLQSAGFGALLADDMGLGKTLQTICVIQSKTLVIAPTSVLFNWDNEIKKFRPELRVCIYHGPKRDIDLRADVILTSYHTLRLDLIKFKPTTWKVIVLDEAQMVKNPHSQMAKSVFALNGDFRIALSGTPVENRLSDLWSLFNFLNRGLLGTFSSFNDDFARPIEKGEGEKAGELLQRIKPFVLRRLKTQVAKELPLRTEIVRYCELSSEEFHLYQSVRLATEKEVVGKLAEGSNYLQALEALLRLRQACCHPALLPGQSATSEASSSKIEVLLQELETCIAAGSKALVFSQWTSFLDCIESALQRQGYSFLRIDGSTQDRGSIVDKFNSDPECKIMLLSLKAAGVGLNLTAADHVFIMDPWWNPAAEDQAADRAHRIGQDKPVLIARIVAKNTVEEKILELQQRKKQLANAVIELDTQAKILTKEDLMGLLT